MSKISKISKLHSLSSHDVSDISDASLSDDDLEATEPTEQPTATFERASLSQFDDDLILNVPDLDAEQIMRCPEF